MRGKNEHRRLSKRLENERPEPRDEFLSSLAGRLDSKPNRVTGWRVAVAVGLTAFLALAFAMTGGIGYAASTVKDGTTAVTSLVVGSKANKQSTSKNNQPSNANAAATKGNQNSSARKQYQDKVVLCHKPQRPKNARTISVPANAVPAHLAHGDTLGPCPNGR